MVLHASGPRSPQKFRTHSLFQPKFNCFECFKMMLLECICIAYGFNIVTSCIASLFLVSKWMICYSKLLLSSKTVLSNARFALEETENWLHYINTWLYLHRSGIVKSKIHWKIIMSKREKQKKTNANVMMHFLDLYNYTKLP